MNPHDRLRQNERVLSQRAESTVILLDLDSGEYYALDEVGGRVWDLCDGTRSAAEVAAAIKVDYEAPPEVIEQDVLELVGELTAAKLLATNGSRDHVA